MTPREKGFLLLTSQLGDPFRRPLSVAQFRTLALRAQTMEKPLQNRSLLPEDLVALGYDLLTADHIVSLLSDEKLLEQYLYKARLQNCQPVTRLTQGYPRRLRQQLGMDAPGSLWGKGDISLLSSPAIALVGSRDLLPENRSFAGEVGKQAALHGITLISGNARGADREAQESCLAHGGNVISVVADRLDKCPDRENTLYLSEEGYDLNFSAHRALSRNRIIHCMGSAVFIAQVQLRRGGTWSGTTRNLSSKWSPVFCFDDGSAGVQKLLQMGASAVSAGDLCNLSSFIANFMYGNDQ